MGRDGRGVRQASATTIEIGFTYQGEWVRERLLLKPTKANLKRAEQFRSAVLLSISQGTFDYAQTFPHSKRAQRFAPPGSITFREFGEQWLSENASGYKASTLAAYSARIRNQFDVPFGKTPINQITKESIARWIETQDVAASAVTIYLSQLRTILEAARRKGIIETNPLDRFELPRRYPKTEDKIDPLTEAERAAVLAACEGDFERDLFQFWFWTGLRPSELSALNVEDVDLDHRRLYITHAYTDWSKSLEQPKTKAGRRIVKLLPVAEESLRRRLTPPRPPGQAVFPPPHNPTGRFRPMGLAELWRTLLERAEVRHRNLYQIRHTYVSMMLLAGEPPQWVSLQVGHTDWAFTMRTYARWVPDDMPSMGAKAAERWGK